WTLGRGSGGACSTSAAMAPPSAALGRKSCPSKFSPFNAMNRAPGSSRRVSVQTLLIGGTCSGSAESCFPLTARLISWIDRGFITATAPALVGSPLSLLLRHRNDPWFVRESGNSRYRCPHAG